MEAEKQAKSFEYPAASSLCCKSLFAQMDFDRIRRNAGNNSRAGEASSAFRILGAHKMPGTGPFAHYFSACSNLHPLVQTFVSLLLTHLVNSFNAI